MFSFHFLATTTSLSIITSTFSNSLTTNSPSFNRLARAINNYYYQSIQILVDQSTFYTITVDSSAFLYAYLYNTIFDSNNPSTNLITSAFDTVDNPNLSFSTNLNTGILYILVVTTVNTDVTGSFTITVTGRGNVVFTPSITTTTTTGGFI